MGRIHPQKKNSTWKEGDWSHWPNDKPWLVHSFHKTRCIFNKCLISNMDMLEDDLCFILDLEGFFINKTFHVRELAYYTWNEEQGCHAFSISIPYKTLHDKGKWTVHFVCSKIHGLTYQPTPAKHFQNPLVLGTLVKNICRMYMPCSEGKRTVVGYNGGHRKRLVTKTEHSFPQSLNRNFGLSQIRCVKNSISQRFIVTQLRFSPRR